ncbi:hypothetical protein AWB80_01649 [Caballeronia pedi]|uniref:Uncharacterized protein n=1 Tax=Caballeronia pedi TaxID=1777141 RepID=A0A158A107_9BURK|nr:hypothetical protein [Caballeronia pedi]SAK51484.1 hypothetical protein AWB80_01649 [Caballeronia pedi]
MNETYKLGIAIGEGKYASPSQCLLMCGFLVFEAKHADEDLRQYARRVLDAVFAAAAANGFRRSDLLETLMSKGERTPRILNLARQATAAIGDNLAFVRVIAQAGVRAEGGQ